MWVPFDVSNRRGSAGHVRARRPRGMGVEAEDQGGIDLYVQSNVWASRVERQAGTRTLAQPDRRDSGERLPTTESDDPTCSPKV